MAINKKALITTLKHPVALAKVMIRCKDKTDIKRYERLIEDDSFLSVEANVDAFMQVMVTDTVLWGGDLWMVFVPNESDNEFLYGFGVNLAYNGVIKFLSCGIRETNPVIAWVRNFFATRTSSTQKIDPFCLHALQKSLQPLYDEENVDKLYEVSDAAKSIPCEAWGDFINDFYPFYKKIVNEYNLIDIIESEISE